MRIAWRVSNSPEPTPSSRKVRTVNLLTSRAILVISLLVLSIKTSREKKM
ncbi:MAG: hypothetical protein PHX26_01345 [Proteiniphilum sp.]|nr:hypothetical protein [Proteiniphilum sp.]